MSAVGTRAARALFTHANHCLLHSHKHWLPQPQREAIGVYASCLCHFNLLLWNWLRHWHISDVTLRLVLRRLMVIALPEGTKLLLLFHITAACLNQKQKCPFNSIGILRWNLSNRARVLALWDLFTFSYGLSEASGPGGRPKPLAQTGMGFVGQMSSCEKCEISCLIYRKAVFAAVQHCLPQTAPYWTCS